MQTFLFFVQGISESIGLFACSLALARVEFRWGVIFVAACVVTVVIYIIRSLPVTFGLHTVAAILMYVLFIPRVTRVPPSGSFMVVFVTFVFLILLEAITNKLFPVLLNTGISSVLSAEAIWRLTGLPQAVLLIVGALLISKYRKPLPGMWRI